MPKKLAFANRREPVFCSFRVQCQDDVQTYVHRLSDFFHVHERDIKVWDEGALATVFIEGVKEPLGKSWYYDDETSVSITAHAIYEKAALNKKNSAGIKRFSRVISAAGREELYEIAGPISYLIHKKSQQVIYAINDCFGVGSLYVLDVPGQVPAVSSSIEALALLWRGSCTESDEYWSSLQAMGYPAGNYTAINGITTVPPGAMVTLTPDLFRVRVGHSIKERLLAVKNERPDYEVAVQAAQRALADCVEGAEEPLLIGLSGGRDSRFVTAAAVTSGVDFEAFTFVPPELEGEIAQKLVKSAGLEDRWSTSREIRKDGPTSTRGALMPDTPILPRAAAWFRHVGGDCWSTFMRYGIEPPVRIGEARRNASGALGDFTRGHYYLAQEAEGGDASRALHRYVDKCMKYRSLLPNELREKGRAIHVEDLFNVLADGFSGFYALDFKYMNSRMRRRPPTPPPNTVIPMATAAMACAVFWQDPKAKESGQPLRDMTNQMIPEWSEVPYFHELAVGTDPSLTNKVTLKPAYWEINKDECVKFFVCELRLTGKARTDPGNVLTAD
ncbi:hypothetical protein [Corynebacterium aquilae]|uniref:hypothetical protein n=1 Tax=Corynebacterium aquilae TaxID=203263 RepID=UPI0012ECE5DC|nr:hypothetical protein [Corynebacterium aquilae]